MQFFTKEFNIGKSSYITLDWDNSTSEKFVYELIKEIKEGYVMAKDSISIKVFGKKFCSRSNSNQIIISNKIKFKLVLRNTYLRARLKK